MVDIKDEYDHINSDLEYILENVLSEHKSENDFEYKELKNSYNSILINKCECQTRSDCRTCKHDGNYIKYFNTQELVLNSQVTKDLIYECNLQCSCGPETCLNRLVQYGPRNNLKIINSIKFKSKGLITTQDIPLGAFICEYAGELLTKREAKKRHFTNELEGKMNYILSLVELNDNGGDDQGIITIVDPSRKGNIGRYINHSCEPNCYIISVRVDSPLPKIAIFAKTCIKAGEELTFNYNEGILNTSTSTQTLMPTRKRIPCLCGTSTCVKYLPNYAFFGL